MPTFYFQEGITQEEARAYRQGDVTVLADDRPFLDTVVHSYRTEPHGRIIENEVLQEVSAKSWIAARALLPY